GRPPGPARGARPPVSRGRAPDGGHRPRLRPASRPSYAAHAAHLRARTGVVVMQEVVVHTPGGHYPIQIGPGRLDALANMVPGDATAIALVTNPVVGALYGERAERALAASGRRVLRIELPDGEAHKDWATLNRIFDALLEHRYDRRCLLVALGGGVIGD